MEKALSADGSSGEKERRRRPDALGRCCSPISGPRPLRFPSLLPTHQASEIQPPRLYRLSRIAASPKPLKLRRILARHYD